MAVYLLLLACGVGAGVTTVLFGFGGGFVAVPLLYRLLLARDGLDDPVGQSAMQIAVATSNCVMIVGAGLATLRHRRAGSLAGARLWPLAGYIALGAVLGAGLASQLHGDWLRWAFILYLALTLADGVFRPGFIHASETATRTLGSGATRIAGLAIGTVAALLGVGGSVMTVPLMRRQGQSMTRATALANPLSLPVALAGTATFVLMAPVSGPDLGAGYVGYIDVRAFAALVVGAWLGSHLAAPLIGRLPDRVHARVYLGLLGVVLMMMVVG